MAHLKKGSSGHLLKNSDGHLVNDCFSCAASCPNTVSANITTVCANACNGTYQWDWDTACSWAFTSGPCNALSIEWRSSSSKWEVSVPSTGAADCLYEKVGAKTDCPTGDYQLVRNYCGDCDDPITIDT